MESKNKIVKKYKNKYFNPKQVNFLKINKNQDLINKWIIGREKNTYYPIPVRENKNIIEKHDAEFYALLDWIIPSTNYEYSKVSLNDLYVNKDNYKIVRSSFIPYYFDKEEEENKWLLGSFHDYPFYNDPENLILTDLGGKCEYKEDSEGFFSNIPLDCAIREASEESRETITQLLIDKLLTSKNIVIWKGKNESKKENIYFIFIKFDYDEIKNIPEEFKKSEIRRENLGDLNFYSQKDILDRKLRTSKDLTDLINFLK